MLTTTTQTTGVLFFIDEEKLVDNGPILLGSLSLGDSRVSLSGFLKHAKGNREKKFIDLSLGEENESHFSGRLFRNTKKGPKSPDYTGYFTLLELEPGLREQYGADAWKSAERLTVYGRRVRGVDGKVRIALDVLPVRDKTPVSDKEVVF